MKMTRSVAIVITLALSALAPIFTPSPRLNDMEQVFYGTSPPPPPYVSRAGICASDRLCWLIHEGSWSRTYTITGDPGLLSNVHDYVNANLTQRVISREPGRVVINVVSDMEVDTRAKYPLNRSTLPESMQRYLEPERGIQSDYVPLVLQASSIVSDSTLTAQAAVRIMDWVRAHVVYDYTYSLPTDAAAVFDSRSSVCAGFSRLSVAMLRAAGIPSRYVTGCAMWSERGGYHAWIEVYYPDIGWVTTDPQWQQNMTTHHVIFPPDVSGQYGWCGNDQTLIVDSGCDYPCDVTYPDGSYVRSRQPAQYTNFPNQVLTARIPAWNRHALELSTYRVASMAEVGGTSSVHRVLGVSGGCDDTSWSIHASDDGWLHVSPESGSDDILLEITLDPDGLVVGTYETDIAVVTPSYAIPGYDHSFWGYRYIHVTLYVVEEIKTQYLPLVSR